MSARGIPLRSRVAAALVHASPDWSAYLASRLMGAASRVKLPPRVGKAAVDTYARVYGVNLNDIDPLRLEEGFETFDEFFTRPLRNGARSIDRRASTIVAPCDGELREIATIEQESTVTVKGQTFAVAELLADAKTADTFAGGKVASIYLRPGDYHRVHCPCDALVHRVTLIPGRLLPVSDASCAQDQRVFAVNERMIHLMESGQGWVAVVMVGAFGVGNMSCAYHPFPHRRRELQVHRRQPPSRLVKGDELGVFHLGSTVLVLTQRDVQIAEGLRPNGTVRLGQPLFEERDA